MLLLRPQYTSTWWAYISMSRMLCSLLLQYIYCPLLLLWWKFKFISYTTNNTSNNYHNTTTTNNNNQHPLPRNKRKKEKQEEKQEKEKEKQEQEHEQKQEQKQKRKQEQEEEQEQEKKLNVRPTKTYWSSWFAFSKCQTHFNTMRISFFHQFFFLIWIRTILYYINRLSRDGWMFLKYYSALFKEIAINHPEFIWNESHQSNSTN